MKVISMFAGEKEIARIEEGKFKQLVETKGPLAPNFQDWYNNCFYSVANSKSFEERFKLVEENNYFCYSNPHIKLIARTLDE